MFFHKLLKNRNPKTMLKNLLLVLTLLVFSAARLTAANFSNLSFEWVKAHSSSTAVEVSWKIRQQFPGSYFIIERSTDLQQFEILDSVAAQQNEQTYFYRDQEIPNGTYYYRIRQRNAEGDSQLSDITSAEVSGQLFSDLSVKLHPNILNTGETFGLQCQQLAEVPLQLILYNNQGQIIWQRLFIPQTHRELVSLSDKSPLKAGMYILQVRALGAVKLMRLKIN